MNHPDSVTRDVYTPEGAAVWALRGRLNTKFFCSAQCADAFETGVALERMDDYA